MYWQSAKQSAKGYYMQSNQLTSSTLRLFFFFSSSSWKERHGLEQTSFTVSATTCVQVEQYSISEELVRCWHGALMESLTMWQFGEQGSKQIIAGQLESNSVNIFVLLLFTLPGKSFGSLL